MGSVARMKAEFPLAVLPGSLGLCPRPEHWAGVTEHSGGIQHDAPTGYPGPDRLELLRAWDRLPAGCSRPVHNQSTFHST